ncbi:hypothetical protein ACFLVH_03525 [Chloroflexota bacterium]
MYETYPKATPLGLTDDACLKVLVKRQLIREVSEALHGAETLGDEVLMASFQSSLDKLRKTLDLLIPPELEELYLTGDDLRSA